MCVFLLVWALPHGKKVLACSCMELPPVSEAKEQADAVFLGEITGVKEVDMQREVTIAVQEAWKGVETTTITIYTGLNSADCGLSIEAGESYLFYAADWSEGEDSDFLTSTICTRTTTAASAAQDIKELGAGKKNFIQSQPAPSSERNANWIIPSILGAIVLLFVLSWIIRKMRN